MSVETADLHFHSDYSDGKFSVEDLARYIEQAHQDGCRLATLTDHDGISGPLALQKLLPSTMPFVCASELSCSFVLNSKPTEIHLLVYGIREDDQFLKTIFEKLSVERRTRFLKMAQALRADGFEVETKSFEDSANTNLGRPHLAQALIAGGHARSMNEAFEKFLFSGSKYVSSKWRPELAEILDHSKKQAYVTVLAHPGVYKMRKEHFIKAKDWGVSGVEIYHPSHSKEQKQTYTEWAQSLDLKIGGGSDFHGYENDFHSKTKQAQLGRSAYPYAEAERLLSSVL